MNFKNKKIVVVGSFVVDMVARVDEFPKEGETLLGLSLRKYLGGKGANQCVAASRLGGEVAMSGMLGDDADGKEFIKLFEHEGINTNYIFTTDKEPTAVAQIQIDKHSQNKIVVIPSANYEYTAAHLNKARQIIKDAALVLIQLELTHEVTCDIINMCNELNVPIVLNPAPAAKLANEILAKVDYLTPNETELAMLADMPTDTMPEIIAATKKLLDNGVKNIISTLGARGALIANSDGIRTVDCYKVKAVDTVGAGDSFNGALCVALTNGMNLDEAVIFANAMGALTVTKAGAIPSLHTLEQVKDFMSKKSPPAILQIKA